MSWAAGPGSSPSPTAARSRPPRSRRGVASPRTWRPARRPTTTGRSSTARRATASTTRRWRRRPDRGAPALARLQSPVTAAEVQQRRMVEAAHLLYLADQQHVIAGVVLGMNATIDVHGDAAQQRRTGAPDVELEPVEALVLVLLRRE